MARFKIHLVGCASTCMVEVDASNVHEFGEQLIRHRFFTGLLVEENGQGVEPPVDILVPLQRVQLVAAGG